jgi:RNA polymerase sigma-70 factor (ECF subfamily)
MPRLRRPSSDSREQLRKLADEELMGLVAHNDSEAFEVVLERHANSAFSLAYRICGTRAAAEEVTQEALLALWRSGTRYDRSRGSVRTWTLGIVHNRAVDALRRSSAHDRRRISDEGIAETLEAPERTDVQAIEHTTTHEIREALGELPDDQRRVIELAYFGGFTHVEIASMLDAPIGTVKGRMRLGLQKLRTQIQGREALEA